MKKDIIHNIITQGVFMFFCVLCISIENSVFAEGAGVTVPAGGGIQYTSPSTADAPMTTEDFAGVDKAVDEQKAQNDAAASAAAGPTKIIVTERVPGGKCTCIAEGASTQGEFACGAPENRKYECTVPQGLSGFQEVFAQIIRYFIYIVLLLGVLGIVGLGMAWAFAGGDDVKMKTTLKHWGVNVLVGLILLFLFSYILMALAPWVFTSV